MALHNLNPQKALVYLSVGDDGSDVFALTGEIDIIEIDWTWFYDGDPEPEDIEAKIQEVEARWPDTGTRTWLSKANVLSELRTALQRAEERHP